MLRVISQLFFVFHMIVNLTKFDNIQSLRQIRRTLLLAMLKPPTNHAGFKEPNVFTYLLNCVPKHNHCLQNYVPTPLLLWYCFISESHKALFCDSKFNLRYLQVFLVILNVTQVDLSNIKKNLNLIS